MIGGQLDVAIWIKSSKTIQKHTHHLLSLPPSFCKPIARLVLDLLCTSQAQPLMAVRATSPVATSSVLVPGTVRNDLDLLLAFTLQVHAAKALAFKGLEARQVQSLLDLLKRIGNLLAAVDG